MNEYFVDEKQKGIIRGGHMDELGGILVGLKAQEICDTLNDHPKLREAAQAVVDDTLDQMGMNSFLAVDSEKIGNLKAALNPTTPEHD